MIAEHLKPQFRDDLLELIKREKETIAELEKMDISIIIEQRIGECKGNIKFYMFLAETNGFLKDGKSENRID